MRIVILAAALLAGPALADGVAPSLPGCAVDNRLLQTAGRGGFQRLNRLPAAREYLTVYRVIDRCPAPVIVRYDIGSAATTPRR